MTKSLTRWGLLLGALLVVGPVLGMIFSSQVLAGDGGPAATALVSRQPVVGIVVVAACFLIACAYGVVASRVCGPRTGLVAAGFVLLGPAWVSGTMVELFRWADAPSGLWRLALEGVIVGALGVGCAYVVLRAGGADRRDEADKPFTPQSALGLCIGIVAAAAFAWVVARESLKGQTIGAAIVAGVFAGLLGRVAAHRTPAVVFVAGAAVLAVVTPALAGVVHGDGALRDLYEQTFLAPARIMPLEWIAGAMVGVPLGLTWAASMIEKRHH